jgi:hypothetical protein
MPIINSATSAKNYLKRATSIDDMKLVCDFLIKKIDEFDARFYAIERHLKSFD